MGKSDCYLIPNYVSGHINIYRFLKLFHYMKVSGLSCQAYGYIAAVTLAERADKLLYEVDWL